MLRVMAYRKREPGVLFPRILTGQASECRLILMIKLSCPRADGRFVVKQQLIYKLAQQLLPKKSF